MQNTKKLDTGIIPLKRIALAQYAGRQITCPSTINQDEERILQRMKHSSHSVLSDRHSIRFIQISTPITGKGVIKELKQTRTGQDLTDT